VQYPPGRPEELIRDALAEAAAGRMRPVIGQVFPLERAADAHVAMAARAAIGKTLLLMDERKHTPGSRHTARTVAGPP
jgi:NADPH:quinone reductase